MEGIVKWFNIPKGYGFVAGDDGQEYFVHYTALPQGVRLRENDRVSFEPADTERGKQARNVQLLQKASERGDVQAQKSSEDSEESSEEETEDDSADEENSEEESKE